MLEGRGWETLVLAIGTRGSMDLQPGLGHILRMVLTNIGGNLKLRHVEEAGLPCRVLTFIPSIQWTSAELTGER